MGVNASSSLLGNQAPPQKLSDFKQLAIAPEEYSIPEIATKRTKTDKYFFLVFVSFLIILFILLIYTACYSDLRRYTNGIDECGNICGVKNDYVDGVTCSGKDMTKYKFLDLAFRDYEEQEENETNDVTQHLKHIGHAALMAQNTSHYVHHMANAHVAAHNISESEPNHLKHAGHAAHVAHTAAVQHSQHITLDHFKNLKNNNSESEVAHTSNSTSNQPSNISESNEHLKHSAHAALNAHSMAIHAHHVGHAHSKPEEANKTETVVKTVRTGFATFGKCVENCTQNNAKTTTDGLQISILMHRCVNLEQEETAEFRDTLIDGWNAFVKHLGTVFGVLFIAIGFCLLVMILFRYCTAFIIWGMIIGSYGLLISTTIFSWFMYSPRMAIVASILTIISVIVTLLLFLLSKRVPLVINLFRESVKAIFAMPLIILEPMLTFVSLFVAVFLCLLTTVTMQTAGSLIKIGPNRYDYVPSETMLFTITFNFLMFLWMVKFIMGCQAMVISGAVSSWYFTRDKTFLGGPIKTSFVNLIKYHLGSVALGSLILTVADILKWLLNTLSKNKKTAIFVSCCVNIFQRLLVYISKNAYIEVAMHGESFMRSGRRSVQLLVHNLHDVMTLNSIGDFVLFMSKMFIVTLTMICAYLLQGKSDDETYWLVYGMCFTISLCIANCVFTVFETVIDTIFLCYCEDCQLNDGELRPYYMSMELMHFFEETKFVVRTNTTNAEELP